MAAHLEKRDDMIRVLFRFQVKNQWRKAKYAQRGGGKNRPFETGRCLIAENESRRTGRVLEIVRQLIKEPLNASGRFERAQFAQFRRRKTDIRGKRRLRHALCGIDFRARFHYSLNVCRNMSSNGKFRMPGNCRSRSCKGSRRSHAECCAISARRFSGCRATSPTTRFTAFTSRLTKRWCANMPNRAAFRRIAFRKLNR